MVKRIQWILAFLTLLGGSVFLYAQNPVSIAQVGTTAVGTTVPVSGTVTATGPLTDTQLRASAVPVTAAQGTAANLNATVVGTGTFATQAAQSGTWTVQPGNTANTTAWKVDGSAVTQPISGTVTANAGSGTQAVSLSSVPSHAVTNAGTFAVQIAANSSINNNQWNGVAVASPDANSYILASGAATATTAAGTSTCYVTSAASTNSTNCKASAGNLYEIHVTNTTTTNYFLRVYNASSAPTCSSATGFVETVPALGAAANGGVNGRINTPPQAYSTGIGFCLTGGGASTDNTNAATGVYVTLLYK
jgi:hypothetical protein